MRSTPGTRRSSSADIREGPREGGTPTHKRIREEIGRDAIFVNFDVCSLDDLQATVDAAEEFGPIDIIVNNAGIFRSEDFLETTEQEFQ